MKRKNIFVVGIFIVAVFIVFINRINKNEKGIPDKTGSWAQINQNVQISSDWQQFVKNSQF